MPTFSRLDCDMCGFFASIDGYNNNYLIRDWIIKFKEQENITVYYSSNKSNYVAVCPECGAIHQLVGASPASRLASLIQSNTEYVFSGFFLAIYY